MISLKVSREDLAALNHWRYRHPHPRVQKKMEAVWLAAQGLDGNEACRLADIPRRTLTRYLKEYREGGIEALRQFRVKGHAGKLEDHRGSLEQEFRDHPPVTVMEAAVRIEELTGIRRGRTQIGEFLKRSGFKRRRVGMVPAKADPERQEEFKKKSWNPA